MAMMICCQCGKNKGRVRCEGCSKLFCMSDFDGHRQELEEELDGIETNHNNFRQTFNETVVRVESHTLVKQIDQWENESIEKIRQMARENRQIVLESIVQVYEILKVKLNKLTNELNESRKENDFFEISLNQWKNQLTEMQNELEKSIDITIQSDTTPLITKLIVKKHNKSNQQINHEKACLNHPVQQPAKNKVVPKVNKNTLYRCRYCRITGNLLFIQNHERTHLY